MVSTYQITVNGESFQVEIGDVTASPLTVIVNGEAKAVTYAAATATAPVATAPTPAAAPTAPAAPAPTAPAAPAVAPAGAVDGQVIKAPMPGKILSIRVQVGSAIKEGQTVCTLEAMKMEMPISATASGTVKAIHVQVGSNVANDDPLVTVG